MLKSSGEMGDPYVQCRIMRSADPSTLVRAGSGAERCA